MVDKKKAKVEADDVEYRPEVEIRVDDKPAETPSGKCPSCGRDAVSS